MIIPLNVATDGYVGCNSKTIAIASNGYICITIDDIVKPSGGYIHGGLARNKRRDHEERNKRDYRHRNKEEEKEIVAKKITVILTINNKEYKETKIVEDFPNLKIKNVSVEVTDKDTKPKITITIIK